MLLRSFLFLSAVALGAAAGAQEPLRLHGSNTLGSKLAPSLAEAYARARGYVGVEAVETQDLEFRITGKSTAGEFVGEVRAHGTNTGYANLLSGEADVWMASRAASQAEIDGAAAIGDLASAEQEHVVALDGLAIIVHPDNPIARIDVAKVRDAFAGRISNFAQLGGPNRPIALYGRDEKSGTFDSFKAMVLDGVAISGAAQRFESSSELESRVASDPNALGFVGFSYVKNSKSVAVFAGSTLPLKPDALSVSTEDYLLARRLYFYTRRDAPRAVIDFIEFVQSEAGQAVVAKTGFVSQNIFLSQVVPLPGNPEGYYDVVDQTTRLSLNFRFRPKSSVLDSRAYRDIDRLSAFMKAQENQGKQLRLAAFGLHESGAKIITSLTVNDRVDFLSQVLAAKGVPTYMSRAFVDGVAVAPLDRPEARARNERVEVWLYDPQAPERSGDATF